MAWEGRRERLSRPQIVGWFGTVSVSAEVDTSSRRLAFSALVRSPFPPRSLPGMNKRPSASRAVARSRSNLLGIDLLLGCSERRQTQKQKPSLKKYGASAAIF